MFHSNQYAVRFNSRRFFPVAQSLILVVLFSGFAACEEPSQTQPNEAELTQGDLLAPKAFRAAVRNVLPSLVYIESFGGLSADSGGIGGIRRPGDGPTTGLIVSPDGFIVTSTFNFIKKPPIITVHFNDGLRRVAELVGRDEIRKICLLKVNNVEDLPIAKMVPRAELKVGQWAVSVGVGFGDMDPAISAGIISATSRINGRAIQTDANTSPANYGGPLIDIDGRVIGVCVPLSPKSQSTGSGVEWYDSGIGFAVPLHGADRLLAELKKGKTIQPGYLGIATKKPDGQARGVVVAKVLKGMPADKAGLKVNDRIIAWNKTKIEGGNQLKVELGKHIAGDTIELTVKRGEEEKTFQLTLTPPPKKPTQRRKQPRK